MFLKNFHTLDGYYHWFDTLKADKIVVQQDSVYGYPKSFNIDYYEDAKDDEIYFGISIVGFLKD